MVDVSFANIFRIPTLRVPLERFSANHEPAAELCRKGGTNEATFYKWKAKYAGLTVSELKRLKSLEDENRRLKHIVAQQALDNWALKELLGKNF